MILNNLTAEEQAEWIEKHPRNPGESESDWIKRFVKPLPNESDISWRRRVGNHQDWNVFLTQWPEVPVKFNDHPTQPGLTDIAWCKGGQTLFIGGDPTKDSKECGDLISEIQDGRTFSRREKSKENKRNAQKYRNPGGGELEGRYGSLFVTSNTLHALFKHLGLDSALNINMCGASWYYTNRVIPSPEGIEWGSAALEIKESDPENFAEAMHQREMAKLREIGYIDKQIEDTRQAGMLTDQRLEQLTAKKEAIRTRPVIRRIHTAKWPLWYVLPNIQTEDNYAMVRDHKLEYEPEFVGALGDKGRDNRRRDTKGRLLHAWEHYSAVIQLRLNSTGLRMCGWMHPEKVMFYKKTPMKEDGRDVLFYKVPLEDFEPMSTFFSCLKGWDLQKLLDEKKLFRK